MKRSLLQRADEILQAVGAEGFAYLSSTSPLGFGQRLAALRTGARSHSWMERPAVRSMISRRPEERSATMSWPHANGSGSNVSTWRFAWSGGSVS